MKNLYPFVKCLHPKRIRNPYTGDIVIAPCGHCKACALQRSAMHSLKCKLESKYSRFVEFVTLTYSDEFVPKMMSIPSKFLGGNMVQYLFVNITERLGLEGEILGSKVLFDMDYFALRKKVGYGDSFPILCPLDLQLFLKRLRKRIYKRYGEKIRYYAVGELGPKHYRPHWHLMLFYENEELAKNIREDIHACWTFGRIDTDKSRGQCSSYVAGYVNSRISVPKIYDFPQTKPRAFHSIRLGEKFCTNGIEEIYQEIPKDFNSRCIHLDGTPTEFSIWRSLEAKYFPRCKSYSQKSIDERIVSYRIAEKARQIYGEIGSYRTAKEIVNDILFMAEYGFNPFDKVNSELIGYFGQANKLCFETIYGSAVEKDKLINSIYYELRISDYFLKYISKTTDYHVCREKLEYMDNYFKSKEYELLKQQLQFQADNPNTAFAELLPVYASIGSKVAGLSEFCILDYEMDDFKFYRIFQNVTEKNWQRSIKHKKLNDEHDIFKN